MKSMGCRCMVFALFLVICLPAISMSQPAKRVALVIGNGLYPLSPLPSPVNDAENMASTLKKCQFNVIQLMNADREEMIQAVENFSRKMNAFKGVAFFYYAGHSVQLNGENYLIPVDASVSATEDIQTSCINISRILREMNAAGNEANVLVLDAAYGNPFGNQFTSEKPGLAALDTTDIYLLYAAPPDSIVSERSKRSSIFTSKLSANLISPSHELREVFDKVQLDVLEVTKEKQTPWVSSPQTGYVFLYYPKSYFFSLVNDVIKYRTQKDSGLSSMEMQEKWEDFVELYPNWTGFIKSTDPFDIVIKYMNEITDDAFEYLVDNFHQWNTYFDSLDPIDIVVRAIDDTQDGSFMEIVGVLALKLSKQNTIGMELMYIPPGNFVMGSQFDEPGRAKDEGPHTVKITKGFFIQTTEVTQQQWETVTGDNPSNFNDCGGNCPVENISWQDSQLFIDRLNKMEQTNTYRLPTEAEWEYAARAGNQGWFCFGNDRNIFKEYAWYRNNSGGRTQPVAQKKPNSWGLFDVHGNVWELCQDWDGPYPIGSATNPSGPSNGFYRVARGGAWFYPLLHARSANRFYVLPDDQNYTVGFRLVKTP